MRVANTPRVSTLSVCVLHTPQIFLRLVFPCVSANTCKVSHNRVFLLLLSLCSLCAASVPSAYLSSRFCRVRCTAAHLHKFLQPLPISLSLLSSSALYTNSNRAIFPCIFRRAFPPCHTFRCAAAFAAILSAVLCAAVCVGVPHTTAPPCKYLRRCCL